LNLAQLKPGLEQWSAERSDLPAQTEIAKHSSDTIYNQFNDYVRKIDHHMCKNLAPVGGMLSDKVELTHPTLVTHRITHLLIRNHE